MRAFRGDGTKRSSGQNSSRKRWVVVSLPSLVCVFVLGTIVGSLLNVCIYRMQLEKSIVWPG